jgi:hypothetical protein
VVNHQAREALERLVARYRAIAPEGWIRVISWWAYLGDGGTTDRSVLKHPEIAIVLGPDGLSSEYFRPDSHAGNDIDALNEALVGEPEEGWTLLQLEIDRDGTVRTDFDTGPARELEDSATDPFWDGVHEYLERNRPALEELAGRLEAEGVLNGAQDSTQPNQGRFGKLFGRRG